MNIFNNYQILNVVRPLWTLKKIILVMKLFVFWLFCSLGIVQAADSYAQNIKISLDMKNETVANVLDEIANMSDFDFFYNSTQFDLNRKVSITVRDKNVMEVLDDLFDGTDVKYTVLDKKIILSTELGGQQKKQVKTVSGVVKDENGDLIIGANIFVKGSSGNGVITDVDGRYRIALDDPKSILVFSYLGMKSQEIVVGNKSVIDVVLQTDTKLLDEVVVLGYGGQKRKEITGAIASVKVDELPATGAASVTSMLSGKAPGLYTFIASAQPGGRVNLRIRGEASGRSPLIVIDGFPVSGFDNSSAGQFSGGQTESVMASINPDDIESIDILKDASATSIYGSKAAGGVILITTKRGRSGKAQVEFNSSITFSDVYGMPTMLNARDYMIMSNKVLKERFLYDNNVGVYGDVEWEEVKNNFKPRYSEEEIAKFENNPGTNWLDEITRIGIIQNYSVNVTGGSDKTKFMASLGYYDNEGVIKNNSYTKYTAQVNVDQKFNSKVSGGITLNMSRIDMSNIPLDGQAGDLSDIFRAAYTYAPTCPVKDENGDWALMQGAATLSNPVSLLESKNIAQTDHLRGNAFLTWNVIDGLQLKGLVGADIYYGQANHYLPSTVLAGASTGGKAAKNLNTKNDYQVQLLATYNKSYKKHSFSAMLGTEFIQSNWSGFAAGNTNFVTDNFLWNNLGMGADKLPSVSSYGGKSEALSYISRLAYNYGERYFVTANFRVDGSSNFAANHQWGYFPGISVAWDISREPFMDLTDNYLDQLKLRIGFGQTGNDNIGSAFFNYYAPGPKVLWGDRIVSSISLAGLGNPDLKWETQTDFNVGFDFSFFNGRLYGTFEYFNRVISDLLGWRNLSSVNEVTGMSCNLDAKKQTYGYEFSLNSQNVKSKNFTWNTSMTFSYYRDRWLKRDANWKPGINDSEKAYFGELWFYQTDGFFKEGDTFGFSDNGEPIKMIPGTVKIKDIDGYLKDANGNRVLDASGRPMKSGKPDNIIDDADKVLVGINSPFTIGLTNSFNYKNFDLSVNLYGSFNRWRWNPTTSMLTNQRIMLDESLNLSTDLKQAWFSDNQEGVKYPSIMQTGSKIAGGDTGDLFLEKAWFIRFNNIDLGYNFSLKSKGIEQLRFYVSLQNPFIITPYSGSDPETNYRDTSYPNQRNYAFGVQMKF